MLLSYVLCAAGRSSFWACCGAPPPPKPKKEKKVKKEKEKKEKVEKEKNEKTEKEKKEKKPKKEKKTNKVKVDDRHSLPVGFQCNGSDEVNPVAMRDQGDDVDDYSPEGKPRSNL